MPYKTLIVSWDDRPAAQHRLAAALALAQKFEAHVSVLCFGLQPGIPAFGYGEFSGEMVAVQIEEARKEAQERKAAAEAVLQRSGQRGDVRAEVAMLEGLAATFGAAVRYADLAIVGQPYGEAGGPEQVAVLDGALYDGDVPVLVCPPAPVAQIGARVVIAWNGTRESMRAVRRAMPFLLTAEAVELVLVDPEIGDPGEGEEPGAAIALKLSRHGIDVEVARLPSLGRPVAEVLRQHIADRGADLLVMGAYGHSRLREFVLGGTTRDILRDVPVPVLMAH
ncbi:MAG TPA: universal stress protein [Paracoccaceae bacterium]|nr:universal stress protein [Paracoccaceae bacterium]